MTRQLISPRLVRYWYLIISTLFQEVYVNVTEKNLTSVFCWNKMRGKMIGTRAFSSIDWTKPTHTNTFVQSVLCSQVFRFYFYISKSHLFRILGNSEKIISKFKFKSMNILHTYSYIFLSDKYRHCKDIDWFELEFWNYLQNSRQLSDCDNRSLIVGDKSVTDKKRSSALRRDTTEVFVLNHINAI